MTAYYPSCATFPPSICPLFDVQPDDEKSTAMRYLICQLPKLCFALQVIASDLHCVLIRKSLNCDDQPDQNQEVNCPPLQQPPTGGASCYGDSPVQDSFGSPCANSTPISQPSRILSTQSSGARSLGNRTGCPTGDQTRSSQTYDAGWPSFGQQSPTPVKYSQTRHKSYEVRSQTPGRSPWVDQNQSAPGRLEPQCGGQSPNDYNTMNLDAQNRDWNDQDTTIVPQNYQRRSQMEDATPMNQAYQRNCCPENMTYSPQQQQSPCPTPDRSQNGYNQNFLGTPRYGDKYEYPSNGQQMNYDEQTVTNPNSTFDVQCDQNQYGSMEDPVGTRIDDFEAFLNNYQDGQMPSFSEVAGQIDRLSPSPQEMTFNVSQRGQSDNPELPRCATSTPKPSPNQYRCGPFR